MRKENFSIPYIKGELEGISIEHLGQLAIVDEEGDSQKSIELFNELIQNAPGYQYIWFNLRGIEKACYLKDFSGAEEDFQLVIAHNPKSKAGFFNLGQLFMEQNQFEKAVGYFQKAIVLEPKEPITYFYLGIAEMHQEKYDSAIDAFDTAIKLEPDYIQAIFSRGLAKEHFVERLSKRKRGLRFTKEQFSKALEDFTLVIEIEPTFIAAFVGCARICEKAADYRNAQDYVSQVLTLYPKSIEMLVWRARIRLKLLEFQGVIEDCSQAIEIEPTYAKAYLYRKKAHEALGKRGEAMKDQAIISGLIVRKASIK